ncbi:MAG: ABC transporter ATP-binding protein [Rhodobacteraceae bacterium]|nr:ABC transporter ATP-binding protein [Paracoccaceae bacterium]
MSEAAFEDDDVEYDDVPEAALQLASVVRRYPQASGFLSVLRGVDFVLMPGEVVALVGPSGSGKSTLLHICGLLDRPDKGAVVLGGNDVSGLDDRTRTALRRIEVGFVYQFHHLLPEFTALENVVMPQLISGRRKHLAEAEASELLVRLGLAERLNHRPAELSGGEQQRVAICRALANNPRLLLADEPTGNLDPETSEVVFRELLDLARNQGVAALIATHNIELAKRMDRMVEMRMGRVIEL